MDSTRWPAYLGLGAEGVARRVETALRLLGPDRCAVCPRLCKVDRLGGQRGLCAIGRRAVVASHFPHFGEEDCLRGPNGSGTIFFSGCNLRCVFCQNYDISWQVHGEPVTPGRLAAMMLGLQERGCHNINFVTPEHVVPQILEALPLAIDAGLRLPIVYNTSSYDSLDSLALMDGIVDIYLPDLKIFTAGLARRYLRMPGYPQAARQAVAEMNRQVGLRGRRPCPPRAAGPPPGHARDGRGDQGDLAVRGRGARHGHLRGPHGAIPPGRSGRR